MKLSLFNTLTKKREIFTPIDQNLVKMYVCGPTVYDHPHIGNARSVVVYDVLYRLLVSLYGVNNVRYVRNITDVDDKIINRAAQLGVAISDLTKEITQHFYHDMKYLGCLSPNIEPKATEHIAEMIELIKLLLDQNIAYISNQHVYFDVTKAENYTKLSGRSFNEMLSGTRVDTDTNKKHQADFVLWKPADEDDDSSAKFDSPFGVGRPGWHIECSAMSNKYLGNSFDIHGGGIDLIFPHHTNEIAQSTCAYPGSKFAKFWIHNGFLTVNNEKMSKSLGNFVTVKDLISQEIKGDAARLFLLNSHYRKPLDYNNKAMQDAHKMISYWYRAIENLPTLEIIQDLQQLPADFVSALLDDLNTHKAIKLINDYAKEVYLGNKSNAAQKMYSCANFLGLMREKASNWLKGNVNFKQIEELLEQRSCAKKVKNWILADAIRDRLSDDGVIIEDKTDGTTVWRKQ